MDREQLSDRSAVARERASRFLEHREHRDRAYRLLCRAIAGSLGDEHSRAMMRGYVDQLRAENERLREAPAAMLARIREAAEIVGPDEVAGTAHTLNRMAVVLALEFSGQTDEQEAHRG